MANCPACKKLVYAQQAICTCGEKLIKETKAVLDRCGWNQGCPDVGTMRSGHDGPWFCRQHWRIVNGINGAPQKSVSLEFKLQQRMSELGLVGETEKARKLFLTFGGYANLVKKQNDEEAKLEREAIQQEGTMGENPDSRTEPRLSFKDLEREQDWR